MARDLEFEDPWLSRECHCQRWGRWLVAISLIGAWLLLPLERAALAQAVGVEVQVTRGPYLQLGGQTTMTVVFRTNVPSSGAVEYGRTPALGLRASDPAEPAATHVVTLGGLSPGTLYHYRLFDGARALSEDLTFSTFPPPEASGPFRVAVWGDSGSGTNSQLEVARRLLALAPDMALHTGDLVYPNGEAKDFDRLYFEPYRELIARVCVYSVPGNHDHRTLQGQPYLDAFYLPSNNPQTTERYYSIDHGQVHFIALETSHPFELGSPQNEWLRNDLATMAGWWTVVIHHHTPYTTSEVHSDDEINQEIRVHLTPLYDLYEVDLVLMGHTHAYERTFPIRAEAVVAASQEPHYLDPGGRIYLTTGGGGRPLYSHDNAHPNNRFLAVYKKEYHATALEFSGAAVAVRAVRSDGVVLDSFTLARTSDTRSPAMISVGAAEVGSSSARIVWDTDEVADSRVEYGLTPALGQAAEDPRRVASHSLVLSGLLSGTDYFYRVLSRDRAGNQAAAEVTSFLTPAVECTPGIKAVVPDHGAMEGGQEVSLRGQMFHPESRVFFGDEEARLARPPEADALLVISPPAPAAGKVGVRVQSPGRCSVREQAFDYGPPPAVAWTEPTWSRGQERIVIHGARFAPESRAFIGGRALEQVEVLDAETLRGFLARCRQPLEPEAPDIRIENLFGAGVLQDGFGCAPPFQRGDCNHDSAVDIADSISALFHLFLGGGVPCEDACDADDSGKLDLTDPITLLRHLFQGEAPPPPPHLLAGFDPTGDELGCGE